MNKKQKLALRHRMVKWVKEAGLEWFGATIYESEAIEHLDDAELESLATIDDDGQHTWALVLVVRVLQARDGGDTILEQRARIQ